MKQVFTMSGIVLLTAACVLFSACTQQVAEPEAPAMAQAEAEAAAREIIEAWDNAFNSADVKALTAFYADDASRYPPDEPPSIGKEAIRAYFEVGFQQYDFSVQNQVENVILAGEVLFGRGSWEGIRTPKDGGEPLEVGGHWISVKRLQSDGSWKTIEEMFTRNEPLPQE